MRVVIDGKLVKVKAIFTSHSMANAMPEDTGVDNPIEILTKVDDKHPIPQVKISLDKNAVFKKGTCMVFSIENPAKIIAPKNKDAQEEGLRILGRKTLKRLQKFITLNKDLLTDYYNGENQSTKAVLNSLKKVG